MIKFAIPYLPESANYLQNLHWAKRREYNERCYDEISWAWRYYKEENLIPKNLPFKKAKITFTIYFKDRRRRDRDNYIRGAKPFVDSLVREGIIKDDRWEDVQIEYHQEYDRQYPRTQIEIEEIRDGCKGH